MPSGAQRKKQRMAAKAPAANRYATLTEPIGETTTGDPKTKMATMTKGKTMTVTQEQLQAGLGGKKGEIRERYRKAVIDDCG